ncbi:hypothetical protein K2X30_13535 [bacterium]|nr:hypothetical protein [bacterium]
MNASQNKNFFAVNILSVLGVLSTFIAATSFALEPSPPAVPIGPGPGVPNPPAVPINPAPIPLPPNPNPGWPPTPIFPLPNTNGLSICGYNQFGRMVTLCVSKSMLQTINGDDRIHIRRDLNLDSSYHGWYVDSIEFAADAGFRGHETVQLQVNGQYWGSAQNIRGGRNTYQVPVGGTFGVYPSDIQTLQLDFSGTGYLNVEEIRVNLSHAF